jgi:hypothetical protein
MEIIIDPINTDKKVKLAIQRGRCSDLEVLVAIADRYPECVFARYDEMPDGELRRTEYTSRMISVVKESGQECRSDEGELWPRCLCGHVGRLSSVLDGGLRMEQCLKCKTYFG